MKKALLTIVFSLTAVSFMAGLFLYYSPRCMQGDCINGCGIREQRGAFRYEGCFRNGKAHGKGKFESVAGDSYTGEWVDGQKQGYGTYQYPDQNWYEGNWSANRREGTGVLRNPEGVIIYSGLWHKNQPAN